MNWVDCDVTDDKERYALMEILPACLRGHFDSLYPNNYFSQIMKYVMQDVKPKFKQDFFLNGRITSLRESLGARVLKELPEKCPVIPEAFKHLLPVDETNAHVKILLKSPLAVALSIAGKDEFLWKHKVVGLFLQAQLVETVVQRNTQVWSLLQ